MFGFERDYEEDLRFIPIGMRYRLDLAGVKLSLDAWLTIPRMERLTLLNMPMEGKEGISGFRTRVLLAAGNPPPIGIEPMDPKAWSAISTVPEEVVAACHQSGATILQDQWAGFPELERYALWKLSRSKRGQETFRAAWTEFTSHP